MLIFSAIITYGAWFLSSLVIGFLMLFGFVSVGEKENRAAIRAFLLAFLAASVFSLLWHSEYSYKGGVELFWCVICLLGGLAIVWKRKEQGRTLNNPTERIDERSIMFSRALLIPGSDRFKKYYEELFPHHLKPDEKFRQEAGLLDSGARFFQVPTFAASVVSFKAVTSFHPFVEVPTQNPRKEVNPEEVTRFLYKWAEKLGATSFGITKLQPYHLYSHVGRGPKWGEEVCMDDSFAIAFTVEMDKDLMAPAPLGTTVLESAHQYMNAGVVAMQITEFIRELGYDARAHIDGNYRVICPLVARDAGLGELGRMGLLMTPHLGPRVRIAVVTTSLPLILSPRVGDPTVEAFCRICKKCADVCPSRAIKHSDPMKEKNIMRWQIDSESCFTYWCKIGTDCGRCMSVCPYSHPNNWMHFLIRWGIRRNPFNRWMALKLDDFFYGRKPRPAKLPQWCEWGHKKEREK